MDPDPASLVNHIELNSELLLLLAIDFGPLLGILALILLIIASALVSGSEVAYFSLSNSDYSALKEDSSVASKTTLSLTNKPHKLLATILITNNFVNIAIVLISEYVIRYFLPTRVFDNWASGILQFSQNIGLSNWISLNSLSSVLSFLTTVLAVTFLLIFFGEISPKVYARSQNLQLAKFMSRPLSFLVVLFSPLSSSLVKSGRFIETKLRRNQSTIALSKEEIDQAIDLTVRDEKELEGERDILKRLVTFGEVTVRQIMKSRTDVVAVSSLASFSELLEIIRDSSYSRLPVFEEDLDKIIGIVYAKDLINFDDSDSNIKWTSFIRDQVYYTPESKKINELLREFQAERTHMAIVVDEFGGTSGLVTLEDILEEVIGDIKDEFDDDIEIEYEKIDDFNYRFEGKTQLTDALRIMGLPNGYLDEVRGEADTLAGVMIETIGALPNPKKAIDVGALNFKAESVSKRRVEQVRITITDKNAF